MTGGTRSNRIISPLFLLQEGAGNRRERSVLYVWLLFLHAPSTPLVACREKMSSHPPLDPPLDNIPKISILPRSCTWRQLLLAEKTLSVMEGACEKEGKHVVRKGAFSKSGFFVALFD